MEELELRQYWQIIRKRWLMVLAIPVIAVLVSGFYSFYKIKPEYDAKTTLLVNLKQNDPSQISSAIQTSVLLVKTYSDIIKSNMFEQEVIHQLHLPMTAQVLDSMIGVTSPDQSQEIQITVTGPNQPQAAGIANAFATIFKQKARTMVNAQSVEVLDAAFTDAHAKPVKPNKKLNLAIALILGLLVSIGIAFLLEYLDNRFRSAEDVERFLHLPVLGTIIEYPDSDG